jgi:hypothetical protein
MSMADENPKEPQPAGAADPGATPRGEGEPRPQPKQQDKQDKQDKQKDKQKKEKQKGKKPAEVQKGAPAEPEGPPPEPAPPPRLHEHYAQKVRPKLAQQFGLKNPHEIPKLVKIVLNVGMGDAPKNPKGLDAAVAELAAITAHARLPRAAGRQLRRPGQLHGGDQGANDLPGGRLRQGREDPRHGYHARDDRRAG